MTKYSPAWLVVVAALAATSPGRAAPKASAKAAIKGPTVAKSPTGADIAAYWRFERDVKSEFRPAAFGPARRVDNAEFFFAEEVAGQFIYDPLQKLSYPNSFSMNFQSEEGHNDALEIPFDAIKSGLPGQSFTLEMFFKPQEGWDTPLAMKGRLNESAAEWGLEARFFQQFSQTYLHAFFTAPDAATEHFRGGHYGTSAQVHPDNLDWRHMAIVCDTTAKTLTCYIDYYQTRTIPLPGEVKWDNAPFYIGGGPRGSGFKGKIDEVRLTRTALQPAQMLRARRDPLANVNFSSVETLLPRATGYIDFKEAFGGIGDGRTDDTEAFRSAFRALSNRGPLAQPTLYLPPGTYIVSDTLQSGRYFTVQGAGADKTVIKLRDKSEGFESVTEARPVWRASGATGDAGSNEAVDGGSHEISIYDLAIDIGKGNPGAKGLEYQSSTFGRIENVHIRSGDEAGLVGLDFGQKSNGPALVKNVRVTGFDVGVGTSFQEYVMTFEGLTLENQRSVGLRNNGNIVAIRKLHSINKGTAVMSVGGNSMLVLLDSLLQGTAKSGTAIQSDGALYALRVETPGYKEAIRKRSLVDAQAGDWKSEIVPGPKIAEYLGDYLVPGHGSLKGALQLPIEETPEVPRGDIHKEWVNVQAFAGQKNGDDWAPAIQAAIDSGAATIYFPFARYEIASPIHLRGKIRRLFGLHATIAAPKDDPGSAPLVIFDEPAAKHVVSVERLNLDRLQHTSPATLVLKSATIAGYSNTEGCGKLFLEDIAGSDFQFRAPQAVWARQWNAEGRSEAPAVLSRGATLWCLGFKSTDDNTKIRAKAGAATEILGAYIAPLGASAAERPIFQNSDSRMSVIYGTGGGGGTDHALHILDAKGEDVQQIGRDRLLQFGSRARMDLFTSDATGAPISPAPEAPPTTQ